MLHGGTGRDELRGGAGNDRLHTRDLEPDFVLGGPGRDVAWVDAKLDRVANVEIVKRR